MAGNSIIACFFYIIFYVFCNDGEINKVCIYS
jgi:hypothetical protein